MFDTFGGFFAAYIPLVVLAIIGIWKEEKLIAFEQKIKNRMRAKKAELNSSALRKALQEIADSEG